MALVLMDVDGTLVPPPSTEARFVAWLSRRGVLGIHQLAAAAWFQLRWMPRYGLYTHRRNKAYLSGLSPKTLQPLAAAFVEERITPLIRPEMHARLAAHRRAGDRVALLSGSPELLAGPLARSLGLGLWVATRPARRGGRYTASRPVCHPYGAQKIDCAEALCTELGTALADAVAYADCAEDLALLTRVRRPVAVHPDTRLRRAAEARGWEIIDGGERGELGNGPPTRRLSGED